jgi:hypothetical protein
MTRDELAGRLRALAVEASASHLDDEAALLARAAEELQRSGIVLLDQPPAGPERCSECGCTEEAACPGGCYWVEPGLCSACA